MLDASSLFVLPEIANDFSITRTTTTSTNTFNCGEKNKRTINAVLQPYKKVFLRRKRETYVTFVFFFFEGGVEFRHFCFLHINPEFYPKTVLTEKHKEKCNAFLRKRHVAFVRSRVKYPDFSLNHTLLIIDFI